MSGRPARPGSATPEPTAAPRREPSDHTSDRPRERTPGPKAPAAGAVSLWLDTYEDIFSDFDPHPFGQRALSEDFLAEAKRAVRDRRDEVPELRLLVPHAHSQPRRRDHHPEAPPRSLPATRGPSRPGAPPRGLGECRDRGGGIRRHDRVGAAPTAARDRHPHRPARAPGAGRMVRSVVRPRSAVLRHPRTGPRARLLPEAGAGRRGLHGLRRRRADQGVRVGARLGPAGVRAPRRGSDASCRLRAGRVDCSASAVSPVASRLQSDRRGEADPR